MASVLITSIGGANTYFFETDEEAQTVYDKVKTALDRYEPFRNKDGETVEFSMASSESLSAHKLSSISSVTLTLGDGSPDWVLDLHARRLAADHEVKIRAKKLLGFDGEK